MPGGNLLNGPLDISGEGPVDPPDRASIDASAEVSGLPLQINITRIGDEVFVGALGQDFRVDLPPEQVALLDLGALYPTLVDWTTDPAEEGREEIDGTETVKVAGELDAERALERPRAADRGRRPDRRRRPARRCARGGSSSGSASRTCCRAACTWCWTPTRRASPRAWATVSIDLTANLSAWGEPVNIAPPPNPRELDTDQLGGLFGG